MGRTIIIGDVHGCLDELKDLLAKVEHTPEDRLIFVGDLLDRGPAPVEAVEFVMELRAECLLGNHEEKYLRFARHERRAAADPTYHNPIRFGERRQADLERLSPAAMAWLEARPLYVEIEHEGTEYLVTHAGFCPAWTVQEHQDHVRDAVRIRYVDPESGKAPRSYKPGKPLARGVLRWPVLWKGPKSVIYGHQPHNLDDVQMDAPAPGVRCFGIDTGCAFGGRLTALVMVPGARDPLVVQAFARGTYAKWYPPQV